MGKKRYFCDLCDKHFADNPQTRKKHAGGLQHCAAKRAHYDKFKEPAEILAEDAMKQKCRMFMQTGNCRFGDGCRFSHITPEHYQHLITQVHWKKAQAAEAEPTLEQWLAKYEKLHPSEEVDGQFKSRPNSLPACLQGILDLPPSLIPDPHGILQSRPDWGE